MTGNKQLSHLLTDEETNNSPSYSNSTQSCKAQHYNLNSSLCFERIFYLFGQRGEVKENVNLEWNSAGSNRNFAFNLVTTWPLASYSPVWNLMTLINKNETVVKIITLLPTSEDGQENHNQHATWFCHVVGCSNYAINNSWCSVCKVCTHLLSRVWLFATPRTAAHQDSPSITNS